MLFVAAGAGDAEAPPNEPKPTVAEGAKAPAVGFRDLPPQGLFVGAVLEVGVVAKAEPNKLVLAGAEKGPAAAALPKMLLGALAGGEVAVTLVLEVLSVLAEGTASAGLNMDVPTVAPEPNTLLPVLAPPKAKGFPEPSFTAGFSTSFSTTFSTAGVVTVTEAGAVAGAEAFSATGSAAGASSTISPASADSFEDTRSTTSWSADMSTVLDSAAVSVAGAPGWTRVER